MAGIALSDVLRGAELAWQVYQVGWSQGFLPGHQYEDFGNDIKDLAENLNNILRVVENAKTTWAQNSRGLVRPKNWDLSSLEEIIGDYHTTLEDCKRLLEENREFRTASSFAYNVEWSLMIQPKVDHLRKRLEAHNSKITILLKPLELSLLSEIHHDLAKRIDAVHQSVLHLQGLLIPDVGQAITNQESGVMRLLSIPPEIERRFQATAEGAHPEISEPGCFPLQAGADALVAHFEESTKKFTPGRFLNERTPSSIQYLNLLKCVWLVERLQHSEALATVTKDSQWPGYIAQLIEDISIQCQRFSAPGSQQLLLPNLVDLKSPEDYSIWVEECIAQLISPHFEAHIEEVLRVPLPSPPDAQRSMTVYKIDSTRYRLIEAVTDKNGTSNRARSREFKMEIDLKTVNLTPIYATPSSRPKAFEMLIHSGSTQTNPTFQELKHLYRLQHLLTGYKVYERYDQAMVNVQFILSGQSAPIEEHGRIQLWLPKPFLSSSAANSPTASETQSTASRSEMSLNTAIDPLGPKREARNGEARKQSSYSSFRTSNVGGPISPLSTNTSFASLSQPARQSMSPVPTRSTTYSSFRSSIYSKNRSPSIFTNATSASRRTATSVTTISTGTGKARLHEKPAKPLLVLFLKSKDARQKLALVAIEVDDSTKVERERCKCRTANSRCIVSCIERSKGSLLAQRWDADQSLSSWNVAALGVEQRKDLRVCSWDNLTRISLSFQSMEDRYKFAGGPCSCKLKMQHDLAMCVLGRHLGIFGEIKQISSQRLKNYHAERDKATGRSMVMGSLPEDEFAFGS
ncbi:hypothetical protein K458DRAFT_363531 [Lentithecium fluviatile CBS 122367]|uniref:Fungal N-terminal domain-containing protein n=1 Tax=Lentithecium fluviatile CBS 122367 TaxID=1168545 RepID=A0A6G1J638_9PLEO|nr:hypothetical protein K458DRAFT_363531 [Lentithecium fluviatile CBS 122367]